MYENWKIKMFDSQKHLLSILVRVWHLRLPANPGGGEQPPGGPGWPVPGQCRGHPVAHPG